MNRTSKDPFSDNCCGFFTIDAGVAIIGMMLVGLTGCVIAMTVYYNHWIFFLPLLGVLGLYSVFFLYHKVVPGKDTADSRLMLFMLMILITLGTMAYGILFVN